MNHRQLTAQARRAGHEFCPPRCKPRRQFAQQATPKKFSRASGKTKPAGMRRVRKSRPIKGPTSLLPRALLVAISLQALAALVLVHFQTSFLFQITHVMFYLAKGDRAAPGWTCKVEFTAKALSRFAGGG
jgi:hypothetical protein